MLEESANEDELSRICIDRITYSQVIIDLVCKSHLMVGLKKSF